MACRLVFPWDPALLSYDFGPGHPMAPVRLDLTVRLARELGVLDRPNVELVTPQPATDELLELVHTPAYIDAVRRVSADPWHGDPLHGLGTADNPAFAGMHDAAALIAGATVAAAEAVWSGRADHGVNIAGGLHHAMADSCSGFCVYNDPAIAIQWLLDEGAERVAYVDVDVHHGDGVQAAFWDDPRVLTISVHESPDALFPGTGYPEEIGGPAALGRSVNVALPPGTGDSGWLHAFLSVVPELVKTFQPDVLVTQHGADTHIDDPLAHLALSVDAQVASYRVLHATAHHHAHGRWLATGGGGYAVVDVVPRAWTHLLAMAAGGAIDPVTPVPEVWRAYVRETTGISGPWRMTDGAGDDVHSLPIHPSTASWGAVNDAIAATRRAVFPHFGLDPDAPPTTT
jgi:acetoin utilization protein AcuC